MSIDVTYRHVLTGQDVSMHLKKCVLRQSPDVLRHFGGWNGVANFATHLQLINGQSSNHHHPDALKKQFIVKLLVVTARLTF